MADHNQRKPKTPNQLWLLFCRFRDDKETHKVTRERRHWDGKNSKFVFYDDVIIKPLTLERFLTYSQISRYAYDKHYRYNEEYQEIVDQIMTEIANSKQDSFIVGDVDSKLAPLMLSEHGKSAKVVTENVNVNLTKELPQSHQIFQQIFGFDVKNPIENAKKKEIQSNLEKKEEEKIALIESKDTGIIQKEVGKEIEK